MAKFETIRHLGEAEFRRLTGVKRATFELMLTTLEKAIADSKRLSGRPSRLSVSDHLLMMLEYNREYRTYFHIAASYRVSEPTAYRYIKRAEDLLVKSGKFSLPGKKALLGAETTYEKVVVDATEVRIERPKKNSDIIIPPKRNIIT